MKTQNTAGADWFCSRYVVSKLFRVKEPEAVMICYGIIGLVIA